MEATLGALLIIMAANGTFSYQKFPDAEQCKVAKTESSLMAMDAAFEKRIPGMSRAKCIDLQTKKEIQ